MCFWHRSFLKNINISKLELCLNYHWMVLSSLFSWSEIQEKAITRQIKHRSFYGKIVQSYSYLKFQNYLTATIAEMFFTFYLFFYFCVCVSLSVENPIWWHRRILYKYFMWLWSIYKNIFPRYLELHGCVILPDANGNVSHSNVLILSYNKIQYLILLSGLHSS